MKKKQIAKLAVTLGLVGAVGVGGTLAALTAQTAPVTNTFAVGANLTPNDLKLDEYQLKDDNRTADTTKNRVNALTFENLMQGDELDKDPTVQIRQANDVADCYMFVHITGLDALENQGITVNWDASHWLPYDNEDETLDGYYYYIDPSSSNNNKSIIDVSELKSNNIVPTDNYFELPSLFTKVTVADDAVLYTEDSENEGQYVPVDLADIVVKACAVQAQNVETIEEAYDALPDAF